QHEDRSEAARHPAEHPRRHGCAGKARRLAAEQLDPVRLVTPLRIGEGEEDLTLLTRTPRCEVAVHLGLGALVDEVLRPATSVAGARRRGHAHAGLPFGFGTPSRLPTRAVPPA